MPSGRPPRRSEPGADEVVLGTISGVFGVRGELKLFLYNPDSELLDRPCRVTLVRPDGSRAPATLTARKGAGKRVIGRVDGVDDRDVAASMQGWQIVVPRDALPAPEEDEFYVADLQGLAVHQRGEWIGRVSAVHTTQGGDVLEIAVPRADPQFVPLLAKYVTIDVAGGRIDLSDEALGGDEDYEREIDALLDEPDSGSAGEDG